MWTGHSSRHWRQAATLRGSVCLHFAHHMPVSLASSWSWIGSQNLSYLIYKVGCWQCVIIIVNVLEHYYIHFTHINWFSPHNKLTRYLKMIIPILQMAKLGHCVIKQWLAHVPTSSSWQSWVLNAESGPSVQPDHHLAKQCEETTRHAIDKKSVWKRDIC